MSTLKQKLAQKLKRAIDEKKRKIEVQNLEQLISDKLEQCLGNSNEPSEQKDSMQIEKSESMQISDKKYIESKDIEYNLQENCQNNDQPMLQVFSYKQQVLMKNPFVAQLQKPHENQEEIQCQIEDMIRQRQSRKKEDQEEKKKQLLLNTLKNKKKPRPPKPMDKPTPFNQLSPPYQQIKIFASYLRVYQERRRRQLYSTIVDLGVKTLQEVIVQCLQQGIISKNFMKEIKRAGAEMEIDFVKKFAANKLDEYDFKSTKFTPLDHRGLCGLLLKHDKKYILGERIYCVFKQITDFYEVIYSLDEYEYQKLCEAIRIKYKLTWRESAFKSAPPMTNDELNKFDTSSIFQLRPSPTFGADLENDDKQFFKAKKQKYPDKVKAVTVIPIKKTNKPTTKAQMQKSSDQESESYDSSDDSIIDKDIDDEEQSHIVPSSIYKNSSLNSEVRISKSNKRSENQSNSENKSFKSSEISQMSNESDSENGQKKGSMSGQGSQSDSMYKSKSKSISKQSKKQRIQGKNNRSSKNKSESYMSKEESSINSEELDKANIFEDYEDFEVQKQTKKGRK